MLIHDLYDVVTLVSSVSQEILLWRNDQSLRSIYSLRDFKTKADQESHNLLVSGLSKISPDIPIVSEESDVHSENRPYMYWLIDPIDGTASWHGGFDGFVSQVALVVNNNPTFGVICAPALSKTWTAHAGQGAFLNGKRLPQVSVLPQLRLIDNYPEPSGMTQYLLSCFPNSSYIECGSIGLKSVLVADGSADLFVKTVVVRDWDIAPASVLLKEVGATLCLPNGLPYLFSGSYDKPEGLIVARDHALSRRVQRLIIDFEKY